MKKIITFISLVLTIGVLAFAQNQPVTYDATLSWNKNPAYEMVTGYRIEYQKLPASTNWTFLAFAPNTNMLVAKGLKGGYIYKFRIFAFNGAGLGTNESTIVQIPTNSPSVVTNFTGK